MKEYRIKYYKDPGVLFQVKVEDDQERRIAGPGVPWIDKGDHVVLILPTYEDKFKICLKALTNAHNTIEWLLDQVYAHHPHTALKEIKGEIEEALEEVKNA